MSRLAALIYAGGRGQRLGGAIKANVEIGGVRLLERVSAALGPDISPVLVAYGAIDPAMLRLLPGQIAIADLQSDIGGPLAGLAGAVEWCASAAVGAEMILTIAVDTPFVPQDYVSRMVGAMTPGDSVVVAAFDGQPYPTNALWRTASIAGLPDALRRDGAPGSLSRVAERLDARRLDWPDDGTGDPFANVNTPDDLATLQARAARS